MKTRGSAIVRLALAGAILAACAHSVNTLDKVTIGMPRAEVLRTVTATPEFIAHGSTEYILYPVIASFTAMYSDTPYTLLFVRLENGLVVGKGVVGKREEEAIKRLDPSLDLRALRTN